MTNSSLEADLPSTNQRAIASLPGPPGWPIVGNALQVKATRIHADVEAWAQRYGPLFKFSLGKRRILVVTEHEQIAAVLRDRPDGFRRSTVLSKIGAEMGLLGGVFSAEGEDWRRQRRMVMAGFDPRHLRAYFADLVKVGCRLERRWRKAAAAGSAIELQADLMRYTVDAISGLAFGVDMNTLESDDEVIQRHLDRIFPEFRRRLFAVFPTWRWIRTAGDRALEKSVAAINDSIDGFVAAARQRLADEPSLRAAPENLLQAMLVAADGEGPAIRAGEVPGNVMTMLLAGEDTTANTLAWMIHLLQRHPEALARARDEVDRVAGTPSQWTAEQLAALPYLEACANETMRLKPVAPFMVLESLRPTTIDNVGVARGDFVWLVLRHDATSDTHFAAASEFRPERWLEGTARADAASPARVSMPFGAGPRVCPGRNLALLEIKMAMCVLLGSFEIESVDVAGGGAPEERFSFTMEPVGLRMRLRERSRETPSTAPAQ